MTVYAGGRGGSLLWCCLPHLWPLRPPTGFPRIWHQEGHPASVWQALPPAVRFGRRRRTRPAHPAPESSVRASLHRPSGGGLLSHTANLWKHLLNWSCWPSAEPRTFSRGRAGGLSKELRSAALPPDYHPRSGRAPFTQQTLSSPSIHTRPECWQTPAGLRVSRAQEGG